MHRAGRLARWGARAIAALSFVCLLSPAGGQAVRAGAKAAAQSAPKPRIVARPIPFGPKRRAETAAYAKRHYGRSGWRLVKPRVIVEHYTASTTYSSAFNTFASNAPDVEFGERPGVCAHFVIDTDGVIYQLVPLTTICRHTVGLNYTAIGIEHVGTSDAQVLGNPRQMRSSLALGAWLMGRYGISLGNVIGHAESLTSRYRKELYPAWRCQTHGDFPRRAMDVYRARLGREAQRLSVPLGSPARRVRTSC